jgi:hypothetical protein
MPALVLAEASVALELSWPALLQWYARQLGLPTGPDG